MLAYDAPACTSADAPDQLHVLELPSGPDVSVPLPESSVVQGLAVTAGHVAAVLLQAGDPTTSPLTLVVWNAQTGQQQYQVALGDGSQTSIDALTIGSDGSTAWISSDIRTAGCATLSWASAAEPTPHRLPVCPGIADLASAGGRIAYRIGVGTVGRLVTSDFDGSHPLTAFASSIVHVAAFDQTRIVTTRPTCGGSVIVETEPANTDDQNPLDRNPRDLICPGKIETSRARLRRHEATLRVSCPRGCVGLILLRRQKDGEAFAGSGQFVLTATTRAAPVTILMRSFSVHRPQRIYATLITNRLDGATTAVSRWLTVTR